MGVGLNVDGIGREWDVLHKIKYILLGPVMFGSSARKTRLLSSTPYSSALRYTIHLLITT